LIGIDPRTLVGLGLTIAATSAALGLAVRGTPFASLELAHIPAIGSVGTVLMFDAGVYVLVAGTALTILLVMIEEKA
jgi:hypothetical protein